METIILDLEIVMEAVENGDKIDAIKMLKDIQEDLRIILLIG